MAAVTLFFAIGSVMPAMAQVPASGGVPDPKVKLQGVGTETGLQGDFAKYTGDIISGILLVSGLIFLIMVFYAGIQWLLAQGDATKIQKAKTMLVWCLLGVVVMFTAYAITTTLFRDILLRNNGNPSGPSAPAVNQ